LGSWLAHCKDTIPNSKEIFPGKELSGLSLSPNFHIHVCERFIYSHEWSAYSAAGRNMFRLKITLLKKKGYLEGFISKDRLC
jgi:hypothetical protein